MVIDVVWLAGVIAAIGTIGGALYQLYSFMSKLEKRFERYEKTMNDNTRYLLKMALLSEDLPITDRIEAGRKYIEAGGNGYGSVVYNRLLEEVKNNPPTSHH